MNKVLSQAEIEALLTDITAAQSGVAPSSLLQAAVPPAEKQVVKSKIPQLKSTAGKIVTSIARRSRADNNKNKSAFTYESYDFRRPDKLSKDQLRTLQMIHEAFARMFTSSISGYLRSQVQVDLISIEQIAYEEYIKSIKNSLVNVLSVVPLSGQMIIDLDLDLLFVMIDRLLGGAGDSGIKVGKSLTDIEKVLANNIVRVALSDLTTAWENVARLQYDTVSVDTSAQFVQIVPNNDTIVLVLMEIKTAGHQGQLSLCVPYLLLKPILTKLNAQHWFTSKTRKPTTKMGPKIAARLRETARVPCVARLGISRVTLNTIANLQVGQMIPLTVTPQDGKPGEASVAATLGTAEIIIGKQVKFRGKIGLRGKRRLAVMVDQVMVPPPQLISFKENS